MSAIPLRPLGFGEVVDGAVQIYRRDFGVYYLIALLGAVPGYVITLASGVDFSALALDNAGEPAERLGRMGAALGVIAIDAAISWVGMLAVAVAMAARIDGRGVSAGRAYRDALRHLPAAGGATVLALLLFLAVAFLVATAAMAPMALAMRSEGLLLPLLGALVFLLAMVCMIGFWLAATFAIFPAVVIEGRGATGALRRSLQLCRGGWARVTGIMVVALIVNLAPSYAVVALFGMHDLFTSPEALGTVGPGRQWLLNTADLLVGPLTAPFMVGAIMILFHDRRVRTEAYDLEARAGEMDAG